VSLLLLFNAGDVVAGSAAIMEQADTASASGGIAIAAITGVSEAADGLIAGGMLKVAATSVQSEAADMPGGQARLLVQAFAPLAETNDELASACVVSLGGMGEIIEIGDVSAAAATTSIMGALAIVETDDELAAGTFLGSVPLPYRRGGDDDWKQHEWEKHWQQDLRRIIDEAWRVANGEIDPVTRAELPQPDLSTVHDALSLLAERQATLHMRTVIAEQERRAEDEALALLLLAA
jgi:hypothetical protein